MQAHLEMGENNIRFEDVKAAADENGKTMSDTLEIMERTWEIDQCEHGEEYVA